MKEYIAVQHGKEAIGKGPHCRNIIIIIIILLLLFFFCLKEWDLSLALIRYLIEENEMGS